jgi:hypothetical protein
MRWRVFVVCWAAARGKPLGGDFVACGVFWGALARAVMHYIDFAGMAGRQFYLLHTFRAFPEPLRGKASACDLDRYRACYDQVRETFKGFANVTLVRGAVPDTLTRVTPERVCYLSIDMNCAELEVAAAAYFWDRLVSGAVVVLGHYAAGTWYDRQRQAFDAFARARGVQVLPLPTGQGLLIKP